MSLQNLNLQLKRTSFQLVLPCSSQQSLDHLACCGTSTWFQWLLHLVVALQVSKLHCGRNCSILYVWHWSNLDLEELLLLFDYKKIWIVSYELFFNYTIIYYLKITKNSDNWNVIVVSWIYFWSPVAQLWGCFCLVYFLRPKLQVTSTFLQSQRILSLTKFI
jgi:hypothetical protein